MASASSSEKIFAMKLASNDVKVRNKALKRLKTYISMRSKKKGEFTHMEMMKLWKGLYYCMWMSDKPLVQEDLADNMTTLIDYFSSPDQAVEFISAFYQTMAREWSMIDRLRMDKFLMLIRKYFRQSLDYLKRKNWSRDLVSSLTEVLREHPLNPSSSRPCGLQNHLADIFMTELKLVADPTLSSDVLEMLLDPFIRLLAHTHSVAVHNCLKEGLFAGLTRSTKIGILMKEQDKQPNLVIDCNALSDMFLRAAIDRTTKGSNRKALYELKKTFQELALESDKAVRRDPLGEVEEVDGPAPPSKKTKKRKANLAKALNYDDEEDAKSQSDSPVEGDPKMPSAKMRKVNEALAASEDTQLKKTKTSKKRRKPKKRLTTNNVVGTPFSNDTIEQSSSGEDTQLKTKTLSKKRKVRKRLTTDNVVRTPFSKVTIEQSSSGEDKSMDTTSVVDSGTKKRVRKASATPPPDKGINGHDTKLTPSTVPRKRKSVSVTSRVSSVGRKKRVSFTPGGNTVQKFEKSCPVSPNIKPANPTQSSSPGGPPQGILKKTSTR